MRIGSVSRRIVRRDSVCPRRARNARILCQDHCRDAWKISQDLAEASKRHEIADAEFQKNSVSGLAAAWSQVLAVEGRNSPDDVALSPNWRGVSMPPRRSKSRPRIEQ